MLNIATVLVLSGVLIILVYEYKSMIRREWGENYKSFF